MNDLVSRVLWNELQTRPANTHKNGVVFYGSTPPQWLKICSWEISKIVEKSYTTEYIFEHNCRLLCSKMYSIVYDFYRLCRTSQEQIFWRNTVEGCFCFYHDCRFFKIRFTIYEYFKISPDLFFKLYAQHIYKNHTWWSSIVAVLLSL